MVTVLLAGIAFIWLRGPLLWLALAALIFAAGATLGEIAGGWLGAMVTRAWVDALIYAYRRCYAAVSPSPPPVRRVRIGLTEWDSHAMPDGSEVLLPRGGGHHAHAGYRGDLGRNRPRRASVRPDGRASDPTMRRTP